MLDPKFVKDDIDHKETQAISGGQGDRAAWPPDLRFDIKNPPPVSEEADNHARPVSLPKWPHPLAGTTLPRFGRLARASALLWMHIQNKSFIDGSRELLSAVGSLRKTKSDLD